MPTLVKGLIVTLLLTVSQTMAYPSFHCAYEKDHNPPLDQEAEQWFQQARALEKVNGWQDWPQIINLYEKAIAKNHWKAMYNLAGLYRVGRWGPNQSVAVPEDINKMLGLYAKMMHLGVPLGYYSWAISIKKGYVTDANKTDAASYMQKAAELGNPLAQVSIGNYYSFSLPKGQQRDDLADQYFKCAGAQDNPEAIMQVADFYKISRGNKALATFYYQKAGAFGNSQAFMVLEDIFSNDTEKMGYNPDPKLAKMYSEMYDQVDDNPDLKFPNLLKDHPLPRHPTQGYDANNPDKRPQ